MQEAGFYFVGADICRSKRVALVLSVCLVHSPVRFTLSLIDKREAVSFLLFYFFGGGKALSSPISTGLDHLCVCVCVSERETA